VLHAAYPAASDLGGFALTGGIMTRPSPSRRALLGLPLALAGCGPLSRKPPVPVERVSEAAVLGIPGERFRMTPRGIAEMDAEFARARLAALAARGAGRRAPAARATLLAVSGGGDDGAFGAGLLTGWTRTGTRPQFDLVTGVSTGALTAPFAFLGPDWDDALRSVYTEITLRDIAEPRSLIAAITHDGMADTTPLFRTISRHLDERMLAGIAAAHGDGRRLFVATTDLDAEAPVIWNIGAIAASGDPRALDLIRRLLLASAAIPGAFPPVMIDVWADGRPYQEMHVDGGAIAQAFLYPAALGAARRAELADGRRVAPVDAFVIRNARLTGRPGLADRRTIDIAGRAIETMLTSSGVNDVNRMFLNAERDAIDFHLAYIGRDFAVPWVSPFEQGYMRALFAYGEERALRGTAWSRRPPWEEWVPAARRETPLIPAR
jgi:hypothetical protein